MADDLRCFNCGTPTEVLTEAYGPICETCADARGVPAHEHEAKASKSRASRSGGGKRGAKG